MMPNPSPRVGLSDTPLGGLSPADKTLLARAPLEVAICEVRLTSSLSEVSVETASRVRKDLTKGLGIDFPNMQSATQGTMQINFGQSDNPPAWSSEQKTGWQIASSDNRHSATIFANSVIWQVSAYERWSLSMGRALKILLEAVSADLAPSLVQRIGLRYVDHFSDPGCRSIQDWRGKIDDSLLGILDNAAFGEKLATAQQQVQVTLDEHHGALLRHGPLVDPASGNVEYMLDLDVFASAAEVFNTESVLEVAGRLNRTALSLFQACVSEEYLKKLQEASKERQA